MKDEGFINRISEDEINQVKADNQGAKIALITVELDDGQVFEGLFREPTNAVVSRYISAINTTAKGGDGLKHHDAFVTDCALNPTKDEYYSIIRDLPALSVSIAPKLIEGHGLSNDSKKKFV